MINQDEAKDDDNSIINENSNETTHDMKKVNDPLDHILHIQSIHSSRINDPKTMLSDNK